MNPGCVCLSGTQQETADRVLGLLFYEGMHLVKRGHGFFDDELIESESGLDWLEQRQRDQGNVNR